MVGLLKERIPKLAEIVKLFSTKKYIIHKIRTKKGMR
jgi:hypothetical protein